MKQEENINIIKVLSSTPPITKRSMRLIEVKQEMIEPPKHKRVKKMASGIEKKKKDTSYI